VTQVNFTRELQGDACPVCDHPGNPIYYTNTIGNPYYRCTRCQCVFIDNTIAPNPYPTEALTPELQRTGFQNDLRSNKLWTYALDYVHWLTSYLDHFKLGSPPGALSVGCAYGHDLHELARRGWDVRGVDHDRGFVQRVRRQHGLNVTHGFFEEAVFDRQFDLVIMASVLPYLYDINKVMHRVSQVLEKRGFIFISIRDMDWGDGRSVLAYGTNVHARQYFPRKSLIALLEKFGFEIVALDAFTMNQPRLGRLPEKWGRILNRRFQVYDRILNLNYRMWRYQGRGPFRSAPASQGTQLFALARRTAG